MHLPRFTHPSFVGQKVVRRLYLSNHQIIHSSTLSHFHIPPSLPTMIMCTPFIHLSIHPSMLPRIHTVVGFKVVKRFYLSNNHFIHSSTLSHFPHSSIITYYEDCVLIHPFIHLCMHPRTCLHRRRWSSGGVVIVVVVLLLRLLLLLLL
jgi:hypothetical protein